MSLGRNVLKLTTSRAASQAIIFLTYPFISRVFIPEDFGVRQIFMSIMVMCCMVTCLQYETSIPLGKNDEEAAASFSLSMIISLIFTLALVAIVPFIKGPVSAWFESPELENFFWLLPIAIFIAGIQNSLQHWVGYKTRFGTIAIAEFVSAAIGGATPICWYFIYGRSAMGLVANIFAGCMFAILVLFISSQKELIAGVRAGGVKKIVQVAIRHKKFPMFETWSCLFYGFSVHLPTFVLSAFFDPHVVGLYSLTFRVFNMPMWLLSESISHVLFPTASKEFNSTGDISSIVSKAFKRLVQLGSFPIITLGFFGPMIFVYVFGDQWLEAGVFAQILSAGTLFVFITSPLSVVFNILDRQDVSLIFSASFIVARFAALFAGAKIGDPRIAIALYVVVSVLGWSLLLNWIFKKVKYSRKDGFLTLVKYVMLSSLLLVPSVLAHMFLNLPVFTLTTMGFAGLVYLLSLYRIDDGIHNMVDDLLVKSGMGRVKHIIDSSKWFSKS